MELLNNFSQHILGQLPFIVRIAVACICGAAVGYERSVRQKDAGIRTHIIVALGSALMMIVSKYGFGDVINIEGIGVDASRIAANIITGISFLGAGVIFVRNASIKGLTTAAGIWATSGVGIAIGSGMYFIGIFSAVIMILIQIILHKYMPHYENTVSNEITVRLTDSTEVIEDLKKHLMDNHVQIQGYDFNRNGDGTITMKMLVRTDGNIDMEKSMEYINGHDDIKAFNINDTTL
ncbi:MAG: MgtC/SapB family protein [Clostridia bacterium]|nr:MgtC/SapB family protein [Clostridia bacterium]